MKGRPEVCAVAAGTLRRPVDRASGERHQYVQPSDVVTLKSFLFASSDGGLLSYSSSNPTVGYGTYFLVVNPRAVTDETPIPEWLQVENVGQMKKTLLEVITLVLAIVFLEVALGEETGLHWEILVLPISIVALSSAVKLVPFDG